MRRYVVFGGDSDEYPGPGRDVNTNMGPLRRIADYVTSVRSAAWRKPSIRILLVAGSPCRQVLHREALNDAHSAARVSRDKIPADLQEAREFTEKHLAEAVASLGTSRLGLLRLTTGAGTVESLTTDLAAAAEVGDEIDRLMDGMGDVELLLRPAYRLARSIGNLYIAS